MEKRGRGRPRKYIKNVSEDFENEKYDNFFDDVNRKRNNDENYDVKNCALCVYDFLFKGKYYDIYKNLLFDGEFLNDEKWNGKAYRYSYKRIEHECRYLNGKIVSKN